MVEPTHVPAPQQTEPTVTLQQWSGPWPDNDPDANFKHDVAMYTKLDPLSTITNLAQAVDIPAGAVCRYVLAKWASAGAESIMAMGATALQRLNETIDEAEATNTDEARLAAYESLKSQLRWLASPLDS